MKITKELNNIKTDLNNLSLFVKNTEDKFPPTPKYLLDRLQEINNRIAEIKRKI